jgi:hypothetical protein
LRDQETRGWRVDDESAKGVNQHACVNLIVSGFAQAESSRDWLSRPQNTDRPKP